MKPRLILASASPRRRRLLAEAGYDFEVEPSDVKEPEPGLGTDPASYAAGLAWRKAAAVALRRGKGLILAADTVGAVDGRILNKPVDRADAEWMIRSQEGRESEVVTALCLFRAERWEWVGVVETSVVQFRVLTPAERTSYLDSNRWRGKSGGYGVQDHDPFVSVTRGSFSNVVGLPMERLEALLAGHPGLVN
ncbi:MAG: Maf family protein [Isosphaeraceae bacterium]